MKGLNFLKSLLPKKKIDFSPDKRDLLKFLPQNAVILEAGVCDGVDTEEFAKVFPSGQIHGFECLPHYQKFAKERLAKYSNVVLYDYALSNASGELDFYVSTREGNYWGSGSILKPKLHKQVHSEILFENTIRVQAISIDEWASRYHVGQVDFLWLDLQGAEINALKGGLTTLNNVKGIFTEVSLIETYEGVPLYQELKSFIEAKGFKVGREYLPYKDMGNVLFLRENIQL